MSKEEEKCKQVKEILEKNMDKLGQILKSNANILEKKYEETIDIETTVNFAEKVINQIAPLIRKEFNLPVDVSETVSHILATTMRTMIHPIMPKELLNIKEIKKRMTEEPWRIDDSCELFFNK